MNQAPSRRIAVFFYGLFMDVDILRSKGVSPESVRPASVMGFVLRIGQRATLVPSPNGRVFGMLMDLTHEEINTLYSEPTVAAYRPEAVIAEPEGKDLVAALCFNLPRSPDPKEANPEYAAKLRDLARRLGFPSKYTDSIR